MTTSKLSVRTRHVVGGSLLACSALSSSHAVVIMSPAQNIIVPVAGVYINVVRGANDGNPGLITGWDVGVYGFGSANFQSQLIQNYVSSPNSQIANIALGATIGNASTYHTGLGGATFGSLANQWALNATNYFGFQFFAEGTPGTGTLHYGYGTMIVGATTSATKTIGRLFYESTPLTAITVVPEPASAALFLAGVLGLAVLRRRRWAAV